MTRNALLLITCMALFVACGGRARGDSRSVYCLSNDAPADVVQAMLDAADEWNTRAGTELSVTIGECPNRPGSVYLVTAGGQDRDAAASTYYQPGDMSNEIRYAADRPVGELRTDFLHEIGHTLGLGHLPDPATIMFTYTNGVQHLTNQDLQAYEGRL